jgi:hypothetical protein
MKEQLSVIISEQESHYQGTSESEVYLGNDQGGETLVAGKKASRKQPKKKDIRTGSDKKKVEGGCCSGGGGCTIF